MPHLLVLNSTPSGSGSVSAVLVKEIVAQHLARDPATVVTERDLDAEPLPHLNSEIVNGVRGQAQTGAELAARELSDRLIAELKAADTIVIGAPMHNFSVPTTLRAWFDHVLRAGETFSYSAAGPKGLLEGKRAILNKLVQSEGFEKFADLRYRGTKRFGLDGAESMVPALEQMGRQHAALRERRPHVREPPGDGGPGEHRDVLGHGGHPGCTTISGAR